MSKSREEIEELKRQWSLDPNWDIESTEGFEDHNEELTTYSQLMHKIWNDQQDQRVASDMKRKGITDLATYNWLSKLDDRIQEIEDFLQL